VDGADGLSRSWYRQRRHAVQLTTFANAACESFMKTLKYEKVLRNEYRDLTEARASIREFLEKVYNQKRLHSALGYLPPAEFERNQKDAAARHFPI
jgi:transposase InsO family protein